jgi:hypothetical protein
MSWHLLVVYGRRARFACNNVKYTGNIILHSPRLRAFLEIKRNQLQWGEAPSLYFFIREKKWIDMSLNQGPYFKQ